MPVTSHKPSDYSRRAFLCQGSLFLAGTALSSQYTWAANAQPLVRIGLVTDLHYADRETAGTRDYRETLNKFEEAAKRFEQEKTDAVIGLGDMIDAADSVEAEKGYLRRIVKEFAATSGQHHYVLGNHCVWSLTKPEFLEIVGQKESHYSFDLGGYHFVILDACYRNDGTPYGRKNNDWKDANIPAAELEWLQADLNQTRLKTLVFVHQRLDVADAYGVKNAADVRQVLERTGRVVAVFQGHYHRGDYKAIAGIHYCTLAAMVEGSGEESNAYAVAEILPGDVIRVTGVRKQLSYRWP